MLEDQLAEIERQVRGECLHPDAGVRAERRAQRLERELAEHRKLADTMIGLLQEQVDANIEMIETLIAHVEALRRRVK